MLTNPFMVHGGVHFGHRACEAIAPSAAVASDQFVLVSEDVFVLLAFFVYEAYGDIASGVGTTRMSVKGPKPGSESTYCHRTRHPGIWELLRS